MDLLLKFTIDLIQHIEPKKMVSDYYLVAIVKYDVGNQLTINQRAISRTQIDNAIGGDVSFGINFGGNAGVHTRGAKIIEPDIGFDSATNCHLVAFQRNGHGHQLSSKRNQRRSTFLLSRLDVLGRRR